MKITLRKAKAIQNSILEFGETLRHSFTVELNDYQDVDALIARAQERAKHIDNRRNELATALYAIRDLVGTANASSGIDGLLTRLALIDRRIKHLTEMASAPEMMDPETRQNRLKQLRGGRDDSSSFLIRVERNSMSTGIFTAEQLAGFKSEIAELKRQRQGITDKVLHLNITTEITLSKKTVEVLKAADIL
jgi:hypothetical protein